MYVYKNTEPGLHTVGYYDPSGKWEPESDHDSEAAAAVRVNYLNGRGGEREFKKAVDMAYQAGFDAGRGLKV